MTPFRFVCEACGAVVPEDEAAEHIADVVLVHARSGLSVDVSQKAS